jgi:signal transduction histidine kinase
MDSSVDPATAERRAARRAPRFAAPSPVRRFAVMSVLALLVFALGTVLIAERIARQQALDEARDRGAGVASRLAAPLVNDAVRRGDETATDQLDLVMRNRMADGSMSHYKIWDEEGRIIWSDNDQLVGRQFDLGAEERTLFGTRDVIGEVSDLSKAENVAERREGELLEVYAGSFDADGRPIVVEAYFPVERMEEDAQALVVAFVPLVLASLTLFLGVVLWLAVSMSRRVQKAELQRSRATRQALLAADVERRRIADQLHDGVIQDLAGLGYALSSVTSKLPKDGDLGAARSTIDRATGLIQHDTAMLRSMMTDIYPPDLREDGLRVAVEHLAQTEAREGGLEVNLEIHPELTLSHDAGRLAYRVVREGLRNVVKHANARHVDVEIAPAHPDRVVVRVVDDGRGPGSRPGWTPEGHVGLRLLRDSLDDFGGNLELGQGDPTGFSLVARFPALLVVS